MRANPNWDRLRVIGEGLLNYSHPYKAYMEVRGGLLVLHSIGNGWISSVYVSLQSVAISTRKRRYGSYLIRAVGAPLLGLVCFVFLIRLTQVVDPDDAQDGSRGDIFLLVSALAFCIAFGAYSLFYIVRFFIPIPTTMLSIDPVDGAGGELEFWHIRGKSTRLDTLLESLGTEYDDKDSIEREPITIGHHWDYVYPLKNAAWVTFGAYALGYFLAIPAQGLMFIFDVGQVAFQLLLIVPPLIGLTYYIRARYRLSTKGKIYRTAIEQFVAGDYGRVNVTLREILEKNPDDEEALLLLTHTDIQMNDFDSARKSAGFFGSLDLDMRDAMALDIELIQAWYEEK